MKLEYLWQEIPTGGQDVLPSSPLIVGVLKRQQGRARGSAPSLCTSWDLLASTSLRLSSESLLSCNAPAKVPKRLSSLIPMTLNLSWFSLSVAGDTDAQRIRSSILQTVLPFTLGAHPAFTISGPWRWGSLLGQSITLAYALLDQLRPFYYRRWTLWHTPCSLLWILDTLDLSWGAIYSRSIHHTWRRPLIDIINLRLAQKLLLRFMVFKWIWRLWLFGHLGLLHELLLSHGVALQINVDTDGVWPSQVS